MKKIIGALLIACLLLASCDGKEFSTRSGYTIEESAETHGDDTIFRYADKMNQSATYRKYSELKNDEDLLFYFDLLGADEYIKVDHNKKSYVLFYFTYDSYTSVLDEVTDIKKSTSNGKLKVSVSYETSDHESFGFYPNHGVCRCILKLDDDIDELIVNDRPFTEYSGGQFKLGNKFGVVDADMNIILPPVYTGILVLEGRDIPLYYRVWNEDGNGILDENYNEVLSTNYSNIVYVGPDRFMVMIEKDDESYIEIIDADENVVKGPIEGFYGDPYSYNYYGQQIYCVDRFSKKGVIDSDLNIIIEPIYKDIYLYDGETEDLIYGVEDFDGKCGVIDYKGEIRISFKYDSLYDAAEAYYSKFGY